LLGLRIFDAGCAGGEFVARLRDRGAKVSAIDSSPNMVELVLERFPGFDVRRADLAEPLDWIGDDSFDLILCSLTLHYLEDWTPPLREFRRILHAGGRVVVSTHHPAITSSMVDDYFETQRVRDVFVIAGQDMEVEFYHRPLEAIVKPFVQQGFRIASISEPPFRGKPWFLIIDAVNEK